VGHHSVAPASAPAAVGPYSPGIVHDNSQTVYVSGQIPIDPKTGALVAADIAVQTKQVLENLKAVLESAGSGMDRVLKTTVYMVDLGDFGRMNEAYATFFPGVKPARATIQVGRLPKDALVEIDAIAAM
jgi:2-iminobutanoate/2-iminopropanoate deaminase